MISDREKEKLIERAEEFGIDEIFKKLELKEISKKGNAVYCVCPFHEGADNPTGFCWKNGFGYCFTRCNRAYDLFAIIMKVKNCSFPEAVNWLSDTLNVNVEHTHENKLTKDSEVNRSFLSQLKRVKKKRKNKNPDPIDPKILDNFVPKMHKALRERGFDNDVREYFNLGYAHTGYLEGRITIPIDYEDGTIITVSGRSVLSDNELEKLGVKRYKIWYDTDKEITLYNISRAKPYIEFTNEVIVVEGFTSVWRLYQWGYLNAVATMGSSLSYYQKKLLLKLGCKIIACGDRDEAGKKLNQQIVKECGKYADVEVMDMYMLNVPEKSSIDDITKEQFLYLFNNKK